MNTTSTASNQRSRGLLPRIAKLLLGATFTLSLSAQIFTNSSLRGPYSMSFDGVVALPEGPVPIAVVGRMVFDGAGGWSGRRLIVLPGPNGNQVFREEHKGRYNTRQDGTANFFLTESFVPDSDIQISEDRGECYITQGGQEFRCIVTVLSFVTADESSPIPVMNTGTARRQWLASYYNQNLRGSYVYRFIGTTYLPVPTFFRQMGTVTPSGAGEAALETDRITNFSGLVIRDPGSTEPRITYSVRQDGWMTAVSEFTDENGVVIGREEFECVLAQRGDIADCVVTKVVRFNLGPEPVSIPTVARGTWRLIRR